MLQEGETFLGKYEIQSPIGSGRFATVYRALDTRLDDIVAIKELPIGEGQQTSAQKAVSEAKVLRTLKSPRILTLFDLSIDKKCIYLIMEYADGGTLKRLLDREGKLPIEQAVNIIIEACRGVADAHAQNTVHRDLKPGNIFFVGGQVKIGDFGLAKILTDSQIGGTAGTGTLEYCAPEQFTTNYDWRVDLWALSVILYELLVGKTPYRGEETPYLIAQITQPTPVQIPDSVPAPLRPVLEKGLAKNRTQRYQSAEELRQALESVVVSKSELLKQATDAFDAKRYDDASGLIRQGLEIYPNDADFPRLQSQLDERNEEIQHLTQQAQRQIERKNFDEAKATLKQIIELDPNSEQTRSLQTRLEKAMKAHAAAPKTEPTRERTTGKEPKKAPFVRWTIMGASVITLSVAIAIIVYFVGLNKRNQQMPSSRIDKDTAVETTRISTSIESDQEQLHTFIIGKDGVEMVLIPAGEFLMGSNDVGNAEKPVHTVYLDAFYMDKYEVTNARYAKFLNEYGENTDAAGHELLDLDDEDCLIEKNGGVYRPKTVYENHPVIEVTWYGAAAYAEFYGKRLPTEAEWEKAARGGLKGKRYPWGDEIDPTKANYDSDGSREGTTEDMLKYLKPIGSFPPNSYDLYDMAGNIWEWCSDWYAKDYYGNSPKRNPQGTKSGIYHVCRGGSWGYTPSTLRTATRYGYYPTNSRNDLGFRCVVSSPSIPR